MRVSMEMGQKKVILAFFDLDGTLTKCDTFSPYCIIALLHRPWRILSLKQIVKAFVGFLQKETGRRELKEAFIGTFLGCLTRPELEKLNKFFFGFVLPLITRKRMLGRLRQHQRMGHLVYIVSASPSAYLVPLSKRWKLDGVICTNLEWKNGRLTGRILGENCRGKEKARRVRVLFTDEELEGSFGYGNSEGDRELLELVSFSYRV
jgi:phosphatidylglycerophosphatase C